MKIRVIPTILTRGATQVKGSTFDNWRIVGHTVASAKVHSARNVDELLVIDIDASVNQRRISSLLVGQLAEFLRIPLCAGGGIRSEADIADLLAAGADKVLIGTAGLEVDGLLERASRTFGSQAIVTSLDVLGPDYEAVYSRSGREKILLGAAEAAIKFEEEGAGELLVQDISRDGLMQGLNQDLISLVASTVKIPVIAGGGAGRPGHFVDAAKAGASAISSGAMLQFTHFTPRDVKEALTREGHDVRR